jgi:gliding motility-associated-like protein
VLIKAKPVANFIYSNNGCAGVPVLLQDNSSIVNGLINQHYWLLPNGASFTTPSISPSFTVGGTYVVKYVVASALGCSSDTLPKPVFIESLPVAAITPISGGCQNQAINFNNLSTITTGVIKTYQWLFTPTDSSNQPNPTYSFNNFGNYTIQHKVASNNGCVSNLATANLVIETIPISSFTHTLACLQKPVNFTNTSSNVFGAMVNSEWSIDNILVSNNPTGFNYTFNQNGNYTVALKTTTANGCSNTATKTILVEPALASAGNDTTVFENTPFILQGNGGVDYFWQPPLGLDDVTKQQPLGKLNNSQQYSLKVTTAQGCIGYDTVLVSVLRNLIIPNAFSPNGDGVNETWNIEQLKDYPQTQLQIFSRNGQLVFTAKGNNIAAWNGSVNNKPVPVGVYYYIINLNTVLLNKPITGWVMVVK